MTRFVAMSAMLMFAAGCAPAEGSACTSDGYFCETATRALECRSGTWRGLPCKGDNGCSTDASEIRCDFSKNDVGDACGLGAEGDGVCSDGKSALQCRDGFIVQVECPNGCKVTTTTLSCT